MQRLALFALCALVVVALAWFSLRSGELPGGGLGAAAESASAARPAAPGVDVRERAIQEGARSEPLRSGSGSRSSPAAGSIAHAGDTTGLAGSSSGNALTSGAAAEGRSEGPAGITPDDAARWAGQQPAAESAAPIDAPENDRPADPDPAQQGVRGEGLSPEEIERRVNQVLPDGSLPEDQLEPLRRVERNRIITNSGMAGAWANPEPVEEPVVKIEQPEMPAPPDLPPPPPQERTSSSAGSSNSRSGR